MSKAPAIRLLVCDVDGTLVRHDKSLSTRNLEAIHALAQHGIPTTLISARPPSGIEWIVEKLDLQGPVGAFNGGTLFDRERKIFAHCLSAEDSRTALPMVDGHGVTPWVFADGQWFIRDPDNRYIPREKLASSLEPTVRIHFDDLHGRIDKIVGVGDDPALLHSIEARLKTEIGSSSTIAQSQTYYVDVTHALANKGDGIAALADAFGVPLAEVAAFGDMPNDLPMFAKAGFSVAMGQAPDTVKRAASAVSLSNDEDGVAVAIEKYLIGAKSA